MLMGKQSGPRNLSVIHITEVSVIEGFHCNILSPPLYIQRNISR